MISRARFLIFFTFAYLLSGSIWALQAKEPNVVVTIKPVHSLVAGVMQGVGTPYLLLKGASSPHHFQLKPSDARRLHNTDLLVWVGPELETPLKNIVSSLSKPKVSFPLLKLPSLNLRKFGSPHDHGDHAHETGHHDDHDHGKKKADHKDHGHHDDHGHDHGKKKIDHKDHGHHDDHGHDHGKKKTDHKDHGHHDDHGHHGHDHSGGIDPHIWLSLDNAIVITKAIKTKLSELYPAHKVQFEKNAAAQIKQLEGLKSSLKQRMSNLKGRHFMVFHDAYGYFTGSYGFQATGALTLNPTVPPSAKHLRELRAKLSNEKVVCVFAEPQYNKKIVNSLVSGTSVKTAMLDPIGVKIEAGPKAYSSLMGDLATRFDSCLAP